MRGEKSPVTPGDIRKVPSHPINSAAQWQTLRGLCAHRKHVAETGRATVGEAQPPILLNPRLYPLCFHQVCTHYLGPAAYAHRPGQKPGRNRTVRNSPPVTQSGKGQLWTHSSLWRSPRKISSSPSVPELLKGWAGPPWWHRGTALAQGALCQL